LSRRPGGEFERLPPPEAVVVAAFAMLTIYFTGVFPPHPNVNELSRYQAVVAFVERGTFSIDEELRTLGDHEDKSAAGGRLYSNKAPGLAFAGIPVYRALRAVLPPPRSGTSGVLVLVRLLTVSLASVVALWRFASLLRRSGSGREAALITAAVAFGTPFLFYARSFFSHAWTAALLFLALERLLADERRNRSSVRAGLFAGLLAGWAAISEYPLFLLLPLLGLRALAGRRWGRAFAFGAGAALPVGLLLLYNAACFGSPWTLSTAREAQPQFAALAEQGVLGVGAPSLRVLGAYLFHANRGALLASPFLAWAAIGFILWWRSGRMRSDAALCAGATVVLLVFLSGYPNWEGGWCLGSRYLLPVLLPAALALGHGLEGRVSRGLFVGASSFAVANHLLLTASFPYFPPSLPWPAATGSAWFLANGFAAPTLGTLAGLPPRAALIVPAVLVVAAVLVALRPFRPSTPSKALAAAAGAAAFAATLFLPIGVPDWDRGWREGILRLFVPG